MQAGKIWQIKNLPCFFISHFNILKMAWLCGMYTFFSLFYFSSYTCVLETCLYPPINFFQVSIISGLLSFMTKFILYTHHKAYENISSPFVWNYSFLKTLPSAFGGQRKSRLSNFWTPGHLVCTGCGVATWLHLTFSRLRLLEDFFFSNSNFNSSLFFRLNCLLSCLMFSIFFL